MQSNIFIPKTINVGFCNRNDTYTKKLAYVIYYDAKGVLRKQASWDSWRDKTIDPVQFENVPTSGFVLNKKVGDYTSYWSHRHAYVRIYDPRDFEFEISVENLLYILENTNSIKGKGLEGDFVYGWDGTDLVLLPVNSPDYAEICDYSEKIRANTHVTGKQLKPGISYRTSDNTVWIYMGRFDRWRMQYNQVPIEEASHTGLYQHRYRTEYKNTNQGPHYYFYTEYTSYRGEKQYRLITMKTVSSKLMEATSEEIVSNYPELFAMLESSTEYSPYDPQKDEIVRYTYEEFVEKNQSSIDHLYSFSFRSDLNESISVSFDKTAAQWFVSEYGYSYTRRRDYIGSIEDVYTRYRPIYVNKYLANGKFYRKDN